jgi:thiol-disulfide isomerase/thioredoxin
MCQEPAQENCKVLTQRGQVQVFGQTFLGKMSFLAEKWTSPRTLQFSWEAATMTRSKTQPDESKQPSATARRIRSALIPAAILVVMAAGYVAIQKWSQRAAPNPEAFDAVQKKQPLTFLELQPLTGVARSVSLQDIQGHVTLLNFWGTWCRPCRDELPHLAALQQRYAGHETFRLLAVSCPPASLSNDARDLYEETSALLKRLKLDLPTYSDSDGMTRGAVDQLVPEAVNPTTGDSLFPLTVLVDRNRVIRAVWLGYRPGAETEMERYIGMLLEEERE